MNTNLLNIVKQIIAEQGDSILFEPKRVSAFFADLAKDVPKPQKNAFIKCLEQKAAQFLKDVPESELENCKQQLAQKLNEEEGLDLGLCEETMDLLAAVLFGEEKKKILCKNCGKELQEGWKACPYCVSAQDVTVEQEEPEIKPAATNVSTSSSVPQEPKPENNKADPAERCMCLFLQTDGKCGYYNCPRPEAADYDCGMKGNDKHKEQERRKRNDSVRSFFLWLLIAPVVFILYQLIFNVRIYFGDIWFWVWVAVTCYVAWQIVGFINNQIKSSRRKKAKYKFTGGNK